MLILKTLRRKLMQKNKFTSYLLYALGEILLVVVGILIAVQFNNQNTQRRMEQAEKQALKRLVEDLKSDIRRYEFLEERLAVRMELCDSTLQLIYDQTTLENRLGIISIHQINFFNIEANFTTYEEMLNTGRLYSMKDTKLRSSISNYYRDVSKWSNYITNNNSQLRTLKTNPIYNDYWVVQEYIWADREISLKKYPWLSRQYSKEMKDIEALISEAEDVFKSTRDRVNSLRSHAIGVVKFIEDNIGAVVINEE